MVGGGPAPELASTTPKKKDWEWCGWCGCVEASFGPLCWIGPLSPSSHRRQRHPRWWTASVSRSRRATSPGSSHTWPVGWTPTSRMSSGPGALRLNHHPSVSLPPPVKSYDHHKGPKKTAEIAKETNLKSKGNHGETPWVVFKCTRTGTMVAV